MPATALAKSPERRRENETADSPAKDLDQTREELQRLDPEPESVAELPLLQSDPAEIEALAYTYWEERGRSNGSDREDWFRAEQAIKDRR